VCACGFQSPGETGAGRCDRRRPGMHRRRDGEPIAKTRETRRPWSALDACRPVNDALRNGGNRRRPGVHRRRDGETNARDGLSPRETRDGRLPVLHGGSSLAEPGANMRNSAFGPTLAAPGTCVPTPGRYDPSAKTRAGSRSMRFGSAPDAFSVGSSRSAVVLSLRLPNNAYLAVRSQPQAFRTHDIA